MARPLESAAWAATWLAALIMSPCFCDAPRAPDRNSRPASASPPEGESGAEKQVGRGVVQSGRGVQVELDGQVIKCTRGGAGVSRLASVAGGFDEGLNLLAERGADHDYGAGSHR
jgi:hypothetical protein